MRLLAGALALLLRWRLDHLAPAVSVRAHGAVGDPRSVHAPLHALHDQVQQDLHGLGHILTVRRARLEVRDPERVRNYVFLFRFVTFPLNFLFNREKGSSCDANLRNILTTYRSTAESYFSKPHLLPLNIMRKYRFTVIFLLPLKQNVY